MLADMEHSVAALLRSARQRAGLTQQAVAARAGVPQSVVSAYERGRREPSVSMLRKLVAATGFRLRLDVRPTEDASPSPHLPLGGPLGRRLQERAGAVATLLEDHRVSGAAVFGSVARGDERLDSDIDVLVDLPAGSGLFALARLTGDLERLLDARVDVVPRAGLKPDVRARVERDALAL
jgi:hypothetical protein